VRTSLTGLDEKKLRLWLIAFFLALGAPAAILTYQAYAQLKWEAFHQHGLLAEELAKRVDDRLVQMVEEEEARSFTDYAFLVVAGDPSANFVQRSPLSAYPPDTIVPGLIGHFQVDSEGRFSSPLLPDPGTEPTAYGISGTELSQRRSVVVGLQQILSRNRLARGGRTEHGAAGVPLAAARPSLNENAQSDDAEWVADKDFAALESRIGTAAVPAEEEALGQAVFDQLNRAPAPAAQKKKQEAASTLGRVADLKLDYRYQSESREDIAQEIDESKASLFEKRAVRKEQSALPELQTSYFDGAQADTAGRRRAMQIDTFESEIDPFEFSLLDSGHFVLFRKVWRDGQRYVQGILIEQQPFLQGMVENAFRETALSRMSDLIVAYQGDVFAAFTGQTARGYLSSREELTGALLYRTRLSAPLSGLELLFSIKRLPAGPAGTVISWAAAVLMIVLCGGFYLMYRLGLRQLALARQQQDFVSAVSHELKTPLTSIRMYGEMLREGWASEEQKRTYYDFIHDESERLSRLIGNVLQLARMTRNDVQVDLRPIDVAELTDGLRSKLSSQIEWAGFELAINCEGGAGRAVIEVDADHFTQIVINLVDNAIKFSAKAERKLIEIGWRLLRGDTVQFSVRDYGPGVPRNQMKKIFKLFYRSENALTRETVGTGIGLALVHQLARAMGATVDVVNRDPGAEFTISFAVLAAPPERTR
jgi:signal transduction histidine kinase